MDWPGKKAFVFTIFDDTDNSTVANTKPVYDLLRELGMRTTKSVWVYPPRGRFTGQSLSDLNYLAWIQSLHTEGFEIGLHNVGDGDFTRSEILQGLDLFRDHLGFYPRIHTNHVSNRDNIYWLEDRFEWPFRQLYRWYRILRGMESKSLGSQPGSNCFWGDACKKHIAYIRNHTCQDINTLKFDPLMPHKTINKDAFSNLWFSSSDGHTVEEFCDLLKPESVHRLMTEGGVCIVYTHFASGFVDQNNAVKPQVRKRLEHLASLNGYFAPVGTVLDHLITHRKASAAAHPPSNFRWLLDRVIKKIRYGR